MIAKQLDGKACAETLLEDVKLQIDRRTRDGGRPPGLAVVLVGDDPASQIYVRNKRRACEQVGIRAVDFNLPIDLGERELLQLIDQLNAREDIDGILVQAPLPAGIDPNLINNHIRADKDVDGFSAINVGHLALRQPGLRPCTPRGVMTLLQHNGIDAKRMHAVVVGASNIVGRPMVLELMLAGATVTCCHKFTQQLRRHVEQADLLVVAVGRRGIVDANWIKTAAVVVDVGINRLPDGKLAGDLDHEVASKRAAWLTPVPGGVGPMTVATLMRNTFEAWIARGNLPGAGLSSLSE